MTTKRQLRRDIDEKRAALDFQWMESASERIVSNFQTLDSFKAAKTVALYRAIAGEVSLYPLFPVCWNLGKHTFIPVFNRKAKVYEMAEVTAETGYSIGHYGIQEPIAPAWAPMDSIELVAVPGVAFDRRGNRLGRGGGYYDRLLEGFYGISVAVAFDFQLFPQIPCEPHDVSVEFIVTETKIVNALNEH